MEFAHLGILKATEYPFTAQECKPPWFHKKKKSKEKVDKHMEEGKVISIN